MVIRDGDADTGLVAAFEHDRRDLLRRGLALGGGVVAAASIPLLLRVRTAFAQSDSDGSILASAIGLEQVSVFAYEAVLRRGVLDGPAQRVTRRSGAQEREHVDALLGALRNAGGTPPPAPTRVSDVDEVAKGLGDVRTQRDALEFLIALETAAVAAYYDAHQKLRDAALLQTGASIMANEGQHLVLLRTAAGRPAVPNAFETGEA